MTAPPFDTRFFGHPLGLGVLAGTEMWERFSFYGMQALLMLYMTKHLLRPEVASGVWGLAWFRSLFAPTSDTAFAAQTFGLYSGLLYATPLVGAWLGDRRLGRTRTVSIGAITMAAGHLTMTSERFFLIALSLIIVGGGLVIGNMAAQVGALYAPNDDRRTRAFAVYLVALNVGALLSPLIVGTLGEKAGWHWGFAAAGFGMIIGLCTYLAGRRYLPPDVTLERVSRVRLTRCEWRSVAGLLLMMVPYVLTFAAFRQAYGLLLVWADTRVAHRIDGWDVPITWFLFLDGAMTIAGCLVTAAIWKRAAARGKEPGDLAKLAIGCAAVAIAFLYLSLVAGTAMVPLILLLLFYLILDMSVCWIEPPSTALISRYAPVSMAATMMAVLKLGMAISYFMLGWLARFYEPLGPSSYWFATALLPLSGLLLILIFGRLVARLFHADAAIPSFGADSIFESSS